MTDNYTTSFTVAQTPETVFDAINNVRGWWSENVDGRTDTVGEAFDYAHKDFHRARIEVTEQVPGKRVAWHVLENYFNFTEDKREWTGTRMIFDISPTAEGTLVRFTHVGLVPEYECFDVCTDGWATYVRGSLQALITTGKGHPNVGEARNESERALTAAG